MSRDGSDGIALGCGLDSWGFQDSIPDGGWEFFSSPPPERFWQRVPRALSLEVKWPGREADHSPPSSAEIKECVELYLHSPNTPSWHGAQLREHRDNFTFTLNSVVWGVCDTHQELILLLYSGVWSSLRWQIFINFITDSTGNGMDVTHHPWNINHQTI
jgi:hypothetical protein